MSMPDAPLSSANLGALEHLVPVRKTVGRRLSVGDDANGDRGRRLNRVGGNAGDLLLRDDAPRPAVVENEGELVGFGRWVNGTEHGAGLQHGKNRDNRLDTIVQEQDDAIAARDAAIEQALGELVGEIVELAEGQALAGGDKGGLVREANGAVA